MDIDAIEPPDPELPDPEAIVHVVNYSAIDDQTFRYLVDEPDPDQSDPD